MVSVVICSVTPARYSAICANLQRLFGGEPHEFIGITDAKSLAEGYNRGILASRGEIIMVCHDDIEFLADDFWQRLSHRLNHFDLLGVAGSTKCVGPAWVDAGPPDVFGQVAHWVEQQQCFDVTVWGVPSPCIADIRVMDGLFLCGHRRVFQTIPFDQETFRGFHLYDIDFTLRASQAGFKLAVCADLMAIHASTGTWDADWKQASRQFLEKHRPALAPHQTHPWQAMQIRVPAREQLPAILRSPHWPDWRHAGIVPRPP